MDITYTEFLMLMLGKVAGMFNPLTIGLIALLIITWCVKASRFELDDEEVQESVQAYDELQYQINKAKHRLNSIEADIHARNNNDLTANQLEAFNRYNRAGIQLPVDILEDIVYLNPSTVSDCMNLIENKRDTWKKELSKKPYAGDAQ